MTVNGPPLADTRRRALRVFSSAEARVAYR
jgi:hypothetical protein